MISQSLLLPKRSQIWFIQMNWKVGVSLLLPVLYSSKLLSYFSGFPISCFNSIDKTIIHMKHMRNMKISWILKHSSIKWMQQKLSVFVKCNTNIIIWIMSGKILVSFQDNFKRHFKKTIHTIVDSADLTPTLLNCR